MIFYINTGLSSIVSLRIWLTCEITFGTILTFTNEIILIVRCTDTLDLPPSHTDDRCALVYALYYQNKVLRAVVAVLFVIEECLTLGSGLWIAVQVGGILTEEPAPGLSKSLVVQRTTAIPVPIYIAIWWVLPSSQGCVSVI